MKRKKNTTKYELLLHTRHFPSRDKKVFYTRKIVFSFGEGIEIFDHRMKFYEMEDEMKRKRGGFKHKLDEEYARELICRIFDIYPGKKKMIPCTVWSIEPDVTVEDNIKIDKIRFANQL